MDLRTLERWQAWIAVASALLFLMIVLKRSGTTGRLTP
jgi:hypothetical protein